MQIVKQSQPNYVISVPYRFSGFLPPLKKRRQIVLRCECVRTWCVAMAFRVFSHLTPNVPGSVFHNPDLSVTDSELVDLFSLVSLVA